MAQESGFAAHIGARHQPEAAVAFQQTIICDKRRAFLRQRRLHDGMAPTFYGKALRFFEMRAAPATFCRTLRQRTAMKDETTRASWCIRVLLVEEIGSAHV